MKKFLILSLLILGGCAPGVPYYNTYDGQPNRYSGEGTLQDLIQARLECFQELTPGSGSNNVNVQVNSNVDNGAMNCGAFTSCVASKGFFRTPTGNILLPESYVMSCSR